jgi:hypothetical protein
MSHINTTSITFSNIIIKALSQNHNKTLQQHN